MLHVRYRAWRLWLHAGDAVAPDMAGGKSNRSLLNGSLARLATGELVQISMLVIDGRGHRVLKFQVTALTSHAVIKVPFAPFVV